MEATLVQVREVVDGWDTNESYANPAWLPGGSCPRRHPLTSHEEEQSRE